jgi:hypothetical protein
MLDSPTLPPMLNMTETPDLRNLAPQISQYLIGTVVDTKPRDYIVGSEDRKVAIRGLHVTGAFVCWIGGLPVARAMTSDMPEVSEMRVVADYLTDDQLDALAGATVLAASWREADAFRLVAILPTLEQH